MKERLERAWEEDILVKMILEVNGRIIHERGTIDMTPEYNNGYYCLVTGDSEIDFKEDQVLDLEYVE